MTHAGNNSGSYLDAPHGIASWLLTKDHKRIAILYLISITVFFMIGGLFAAGIRAELLTPAGDLFTADLYNKVFTLHGVVMIFFFLVPSVPVSAPPGLPAARAPCRLLRYAPPLVGEGWG